ncbi:MAG: glycerate kinase [Bacteroidota bacterium]
MQILIATDSFKDSLSAYEAGKQLASGLKAVLNTASIEILPMADGGEGTLNALIDATNGYKIKTEVHDPLMRKIEAHFGIPGNRNTAVIEMATASGIELLNDEEKDPHRTTSYGTGELIKAALEENCPEIILGIGGSATIDGGAGLMAALGVTFTDNNNEKILPRGGNLREIKHINLERIDKRLKNTTIRIACDVNNPLTGKNGAAYVFGPQKGAKKEDIRFFDNNLRHLSQLLTKTTGFSDESTPGTGAAGGLPACIKAFTEASLENGFDLVSELVNLENQIKQSDLIITGEGKLDFQTQYGKTPWGVAQIATKHNKPLIAIGGTITEDSDSLYNQGFDLILPILNRPMSLNEALKETPELLRETGKRIARIILLNK